MFINPTLEEIINLLEKDVLEKVPAIVKPTVKSQIDNLKEYIIDSRAPRFAIIGRRGAGKSSLINAIFGSEVASVGSVKSKTGKATWHEYTDNKGKIEILDTRGIGEGSKPDEEVGSLDVLEDLKIPLKEKFPDAILFLCKSKEVDARIDEDLNQLNLLLKYIEKEHDYKPPVIGVVTQVDELDPADINQPPYDDEEKIENIEKAVQILKDKMSLFDSQTLKVLPLSAYMRFKNGKAISDRRWNIDVLTEYLIEKLPREAMMEMARSAKAKSVQKKLSRSIGASISIIAGGIGATPIPVGDLPMITSMQLLMIICIAYVSGRELDKQAAMEFIGALGVNVGAGFILREAARALVKFVFPVAGNAVSGVIASAGTYGLCEAAIAYFIDNKTIEEAKEAYNDKKEEHTKNQEDLLVKP